MEQPVDVCIIGGGPAGAITALELVRMGLKVHVFDWPLRRFHWPESVPPILSALFDQLGLLSALKKAAWTFVLEKSLLWNGEAPIRIPQAGSLIVHRGRFDAVLREAARQEGAVITTALAGTPVKVGDGLWQVPVLHKGDRAVRARFVVVASGRRRTRFDCTVPRAAPLIAYYGIAPSASFLQRVMTVGSSDVHWYWGTSTPDALYHVLAFASLRSPIRSVPFLSLLQRSLPTGVDGAKLVFVGGADATPRSARVACADAWLRVGDALLSSDPLNSSGLYTASLTASQAARVINTVLRRPEESLAAYDFYMSVQREIAAHCASTATAFYDAGMRTPDSTAAPSTSNGERCRLSELVLSPDFCFQPVPVLLGDFITTMPGLRRRHGKSLVSIDGVPLARLLAPMQAGTTLLHASHNWTMLSKAGIAQLIKFLVEENIVVQSLPSS